MKIALDTKVLAYAEGFDDVQRRDTALSIVRRLPRDDIEPVESDVDILLKRDILLPPRDRMYSMSKYEPLANFLSRQTQDEVRLTFDEVETVLGGPLPKSASEYQAWWANDPGHSQCRSWHEAGWKTENLNLTRRVVSFVRTAPFPKPGRSRSSSNSPSSLDPWGALEGSVTIHDESALTSPTGEIWDAEESRA